MKRNPVLLVTAAAAVLLAGCAGTAGSDDDRPSVAASFYPFAFVVEQVGGSFIQVENLTSPGVEPHDVELTPKQVGRVQDADVLVFARGFKAAVDDAIEQAGREDAATIDVAAIVDDLPADDAHDEDDGHNHDHDETDPHSWLNPQNMVTVTRAVADALASVDPAHAQEFASNADALVAELESLDADFSAGLQTCERRTIVTSHAAFAHLAARYDLVQVPIAGLDPSNEPSPRELAAVTRLVRSEGITTVFTEELVSPAIARTVADETGVQTATLDPIEGLGDDTRDETYVTLMRRNLEALRTANSCQ
ncbi:MAG: metal ABC transporter substrate-binding protein [Aeromicrobium sp.]